MQSFIPLLIGLIIFVCASGYMLYRNNAAKVEQRAREKKRNQYNDRV